MQKLSFISPSALEQRLFPTCQNHLLESSMPSTQRSHASLLMLPFGGLISSHSNTLIIGHSFTVYKNNPLSDLMPFLHYHTSSSLSFHPSTIRFHLTALNPKKVFNWILSHLLQWLSDHTSWSVLLHELISSAHYSFI